MSRTLLKYSPVAVWDYPLTCQFCTPRQFERLSHDQAQRAEALLRAAAVVSRAITPLEVRQWTEFLSGESVEALREATIVLYEEHARFIRRVCRAIGES